MLEKEFFLLASKYVTDQQQIASLWRELEIAYTQPDRQFHNLHHLQQMLLTLQPFQLQVDDWDTLLFALFYHDAVYDVVQYVTENNNEDQSAAMAARALESIGYPTQKIERCRQHILATKTHRYSMDSDTNFLIDADLSILGQSWETYDVYMKAIRKEYDVFPDPIYNAGRVNVLKGFKRMEYLYKTPLFRDRFENTAKENIERELEILSFY